MPNSYPSTNSHRANYYSSLTASREMPPASNKRMYFTYSSNNIYKPHSAIGMVGTTSSSYRARRRRI